MERDRFSLLLFLALPVCACISTAYRKLNRPRIVHRSSSSHLAAMVEKCPSLRDYRPNPLFMVDWHGHVHTIMHTIVRTFLSPGIEASRREIFRLQDQGTVGLDWFLPHDQEDAAKDGSPIVVMIHGLCGEPGSHYIQHAIEFYLAKQWTVVLLVARGWLFA